MLSADRILERAAMFTKWKVHESCMLAMGSVTDLVTESIQSGKVQFHITGFLQPVVLADMNFRISPFLVGRSFWSAILHTEVTSTSPELLNRVDTNLRHPGIVQHLKSANTTQYLIPFLSNILDRLLSIATQFSSDVLSLCLETLPILLTEYQAFIASIESKIKWLDEDEDEDEDDWEDEDAEEEIQMRGQILSDLIDSMAAKFNGYDVDKEEEEDPDFSKDPTYQIDLQVSVHVSNAYE
uniref:Importin-9 n=1 Tax=Magallana gigas TaxID=29159 RepID=A0A8W8MUY6_MAGGI